MTRFFADVGYDSVVAVMKAFHAPLAHAGVCQRALLLLCLAEPLPWLTAAETAACAAWYAALLNDEHPELRLCGVLSLQRLQAGHRIPEAEAAGIGARLRDDCPKVRRAALGALGALGRRRAEASRGVVLALLADPAAEVRRAALRALRSLAPTTDGGVVALLRERACRLEAFKVLQQAGASAAQHQAELERWKHLSYFWSRLAARALVRPDSPLAHTCLGRATLPFAVAAEWCCSGMVDQIRRQLDLKMRRLASKIRKLKASATPLSKKKARKLRNMKQLRRDWTANFCGAADGLARRMGR